MPSPFLGLNPYLEQPALRPDFHVEFLHGIKEMLAPLIRPRYFALLERHVFIHEPPEAPATQRLRADQLVAAPRRVEEGGAAVMEDVAAPVQIEHLTQEVERIAYLEVRETASGDVVAVVELLSPANKREDRLTYLARREMVLGSAAHLVEVDLLRGERCPRRAGRPAPTR